MDDREIIAKNLTKLRIANRLTQAELAEQLNYTDKAISKWERGESLPDVLTLKKVATILGSDVNFILSPHEEEEFETQKKTLIASQNRIAICALAIAVIWLVATLVFVYFKIYENIDLWQSFVAGAPASFFILFIFVQRWYKHKRIISFISLSAFMWSFIAFIYLAFLSLNMWALFFIGVPIQVIFILAFKLKK